MIPAIVYLRASDPRQDRSVGDQRADILARAEQDSVRIIQWFVDDGLSGRTVEHRPGLLAMRAWVQGHAGEARVLYAWAQSRLGRHAADTLTTLAILDVARIETRFLTDAEPEDVDARELIRLIRAGIDAQHSRRLSKDVPRGMRSVAREGRYPGPPPYGYVAEHSIPGKAGRLVPVPEQADVVREIVRLYGDRGDKDVAKILTSRGVPPPDHPTHRRQRAPGTWRAKHVKRILTTATYAGRIVLKGEVLCDAAHEPLIPPEQFDRLQALRRSRYRERRRENPVTASERGLFKPWLRCEHCGGGMRSSRGSRGEMEKWHYQCATRAQNTAACVGTNAPLDDLDTLLLDKVIDDILTDDALRAAWDRWRASLEGDGRRDILARREAVQARIDTADAAIKRTVGMVARGLAEEADVAEELRLHRAARDAARDDLALLPSAEALALPQFDLPAFRRRVTAALRSAALPKQRQALASIITAINLDPGVATIRYRPRGSGANHHHDPPGPPNAPMSFLDPSASLYAAAGFPALIDGELVRSEKSSLYGFPSQLTLVKLEPLDKAPVPADSVPP